MEVFLSFVFFLIKNYYFSFIFCSLFFFHFALIFLENPFLRSSLIEEKIKTKLNSKRLCIHQYTKKLRPFCRLLFILSIFFFVVGSFLYLLKHLQINLPQYPSEIPSQTLVSVLPMKVIDKKKEKFFFRYNPSFIKIQIINETYYLAAIRESTSQWCKNFIYRTDFFINKQTFSNTIFGLGKNLSDLKFAGNMTIIDNSPNVTHPGFEDPRIFKYKDDTELGVVNGHMFKLYISKIDIIKNQNQKYEVIEKSRALIQPLFAATEKQKNWVRFPAEDEGSEKPWFVYNFNPLKIVEIDVDTGYSTLLSVAPKIQCLKTFLKGSTNLIKSPHDKDLYIGIIHDSQYVESAKLSAYSSYFVGVRYDKEELDILLELMSKPFKIPINVKDKNNPEKTLANPIHFPMALDCLDDNCEKLVVSMGEMDCNPYFVEFDTEKVINMLEKITCA